MKYEEWALEHDLSKKTEEGWVCYLDRNADEKAFLRPIWYRAWENAYGNSNGWSGPISYYEIKLNNSFAGIFPLTLQKKYILNFLSLPGLYFPFRAIPLFDFSRESCECMIDSVGQISNICGIRLGPVSLDNQYLMKSIEMFRVRGWSLHIIKLGVNYTVSLPISIELFYSTHKAKIKKINKYYNKINRDLDFKVIHYNDCSISDWSIVHKNIADIEAMSWVASKGEPRFFGNRNQQFWGYLVTDSWMRRAIHVWITFISSKPVAYGYCFDSNETRYFLSAGYDLKYAQYSMGSILHKERIVDAISRGIKTIDFGMGDPGFKSSWGGAPAIDLFEILLFPPNFKGKAMNSLLKTKNLTKKLIENIKRF